MTSANLPLLIVAVLAVIGIAVALRLGRARRRDEPLAPPAADPSPPISAPAPTIQVETPAPQKPVVEAPVPVSETPPPPPPSSPASAPSAPKAANDYADRPVTTIKGLGPKVAARLGELSVITVGDLARLTDAEAADLDVQLGTFQGRMMRERWIEQARLLVSGDVAAFETQFGKLGS